MLNGGYIMVSKTDTDLYKKLNNALTLGKPVLFYENDTTCYYIDTIALSGDDIVLTKGGKTITITDANVVTESGSIQNHLYLFTLDIDDLSLATGYSLSTGRYASFFSTINLDGKKYSEIPDGDYQCFAGNVKDVNNDIIPILSLHVNNGTFQLYLRNDDTCDFTINNDNEYGLTQLF